MPDKLPTRSESHTLCPWCSNHFKECTWRGHALLDALFDEREKERAELITIADKTRERIAALEKSQKEHAAKCPMIPVPGDYTWP